MLGLGIANVIVFFIAAAICLIFVVAWIIKSEARRNILRSEIRKLKAQIGSYETEKFALLEKVSSLENAPVESGEGRGNEESKELRKKNKALEDENKRLKLELKEAKSSLEEVYKALS